MGALTAIQAQIEADVKDLAVIKAQIKAHRWERAQKAAQEKAHRGGTRATATATGPSAPAAATATTSIPEREFQKTWLQIQLASGGRPLTTTLPSDASCVPFLRLSSERLASDCCTLALREVEKLVVDQTLAVLVEGLSFAQLFPWCVSPLPILPYNRLLKSIHKGNNFPHQISRGLSWISG